MTDDLIARLRSPFALATEEEVIARLEALQTEVERLRKDAERYQWLRKEARLVYAGQSVIRTPLKKGTPFIEFPNWISANDWRVEGAPNYAANYDAAIDSAMNEQAERRKAQADRLQAQKDKQSGERIAGEDGR